MEAVPGVNKVDVDFDAKTATVTMDAGTKPADVAKALSGQFSGSVKN